MPWDRSEAGSGGSAPEELAAIDGDGFVVHGV
jgi:hypothetical protein